MDNRLAFWVLRLACVGLIGCSSGCSSGGADRIVLGQDDIPRCKSGNVFCEDACIDPQTDARHCGASGSCLNTAAGVSCGRDAACIEGTCKSVCGAGKISCAGACIDPATDPAHCGASGDCSGNTAGAVCQPTTGRCAAMVGAICQAGRCLNDCPHGMQVFSFTGKVETFALPPCVTEITVKAFGAQGGSSTPGSQGGKGAMVQGSVCVTPGTTLTIVVGEQAPSALWPSGGGGASYVAAGNTPLFVAGGGGGGYSDWAPGGAATTLATSGAGLGGATYNNGGGGGGFSTDGMGPAGTAGLSFLHGAAGGMQYPTGNTNATRGGFGGGGGASESSSFNAGGGGGYDGGKAGNGNASTGGTSYMGPMVANPQFTGDTRIGPGSVEISY